MFVCLNGQRDSPLGYSKHLVQAQTTPEHWPVFSGGSGKSFGAKNYSMPFYLLFTSATIFPLKEENSKCL